MKLIDRVLRSWRTSVAISALPSQVNSVFDIGCDDGYLLNKIDDGKILLYGCDPRLQDECSVPRSKLFCGFFPNVLNCDEFSNSCDAIFALAVFEHFSEVDLINSSRKISEILSDRGLLIVTVPHPFVDKILHILMALRLIDGQALHEHHGFNPSTLINIFSRHLFLREKKTFQLGLNNLYVFEKIKKQSFQ
jgi:hypothetical protein